MDTLEHGFNEKNIHNAIQKYNGIMENQSISFRIQC